MGRITSYQILINESLLFENLEIRGRNCELLCSIVCNLNCCIFQKQCHLRSIRSLEMVLSGYPPLGGIAGTRQHVASIAHFLRLHEWLWRAHVVDFFQGKLWERLDEQWIACLRHASVEDWLQLPSGLVQESWPESLKEFVQTASSLSLSRMPAASSANMSCTGVSQASIGNVLSQGMSAKKIHEIRILAALIATTAESKSVKDVIDVGAGQGYLALVLAFEYQLAVVAVDACAHHADVTNERSLRIQQYYNARLRKAQQDGLTLPVVHAPQTVTCTVGSGEVPTSLSSLLPAMETMKAPRESTMTSEDLSTAKSSDVMKGKKKELSVVLAGLHACGDLSATMLRTFVECKGIAGVINVGCCYNLLSEASSSTDSKSSFGFPMSQGVGQLGLHLGRSARDLACQSADRWKDHHPDRALQNFELHSFRAAFQLILLRFYPETALQSPSVGRSGKSRRRRQSRRAAALPLEKGVIPEALSSSLQAEVDKFTANSSNSAVAPNDVSTSSLVNAREFEMPKALEVSEDCKKPSLEQQVAGFEKYSSSALDRLNLPSLPSHEFKSLWAEVAPYQDLVGPFWSLRAALAPVIESYILLDRLFYIEEQAELTGGRIVAELVPIFNPLISPRNMAIIAHRV